MKTLEELTAYLEKELGYDATVANEYKCRKCGHHEQILDHWIDHKTALASNICSFLGFKSRLREKIEEVVRESIDNYWDISGDAFKDAPKLAKQILEDLGENGTGVIEG